MEPAAVTSKVPALTSRNRAPRLVPDAVRRPASDRGHRRDLRPPEFHGGHRAYW